LAVGSFTPRKNLALLLEAFDRFKEKTGSNHELVLVGDSLHADPAFDKALKNTQHRSSVVFPGRAKSDALQSLLGAAEALCFPSFFEGFGIPLVEAFQAGTPVISSSASCMPEIVGDAGWLVDPHSATDWANALERMTALPLSERQSLVERGLRRAADFSWDRSAETVFNVLSRAASRS
jgi:glycosyltransferase involved in cell wall biosynthesis